MDLLPFLIIGFIVAGGLWILFIILYERPRKPAGLSTTKPTANTTETATISEPGIYGKRLVGFHEFESRKKPLSKAFWRTSIIVFLIYVCVVVGYVFWNNLPLLIFVIGFVLITGLIALIKQSINRASMKPLMKAARKGDAQKCQHLLNQGEKINTRSAFGDTPLILACQGLHLDTVRLLLAKGATVNVYGTEKRSPLIVTTLHQEAPQQVEIAKLLVEKGAEIDAVDKHQMTALMYAVEGGKLSLVKLLIEQGADVNKEVIIRERSNTNGDSVSYEFVHRSALSLAGPNHPEIREILIAAGAKETFDEQVGRL